MPARTLALNGSVVWLKAVGAFALLLQRLLMGVGSAAEAAGWKTPALTPVGLQWGLDLGQVFPSCSVVLSVNRKWENKLENSWVEIRPMQVQQPQVITGKCWKATLHCFVLQGHQSASPKYTCIPKHTCSEGG